MGTRFTLLRPGIVPYTQAWDLQRRVAEQVAGGGDETLILLQHPPTYTLGVRGRDEHLLLPEDAIAGIGATLVRSDRGGEATFHGPGQIVGYPILNLRSRGLGPASYVRSLEQTIIDAVAPFGVTGERRDGLPGVWTASGKLAAIGVRVSRGVSLHGFALNVSTELSFFAHIIPCGMPGAAVTSLARELEAPVELPDVEEALIAAFSRIFACERAEALAW